MSATRPRILVIGAGLGGTSAALTALRLGAQVTLVEETGWLGGQLTTQAVPPDEHAWIETPLVSPGYADLRNRIREHYRRAYPLGPISAADPLLDPGLGVVSKICHEPRAAAAVLDELIAPWLAGGRLTVLRHWVPVSVSVDRDRVSSVVVRGAAGQERELSADIVVDATELGDVIALADAEHVIGAEGADDTGELHAPPHADPTDQQAISWCFAMSHHPGEDHTVPEPARYRHWRSHVSDFWPGPQLGWADVDPISLQPRKLPLFTGDPPSDAPFSWWRFRRILAAEHYPAGTIDHDITLVNWPQIDYWEAPLLGPGADPARVEASARELSLSFLHWMQTEAPRPDGGQGYPGLRLRADAVGSDDGLALRPYIRESRRAITEFRVLEQHVGVQARGLGAGSEVFADSVGLGHYRIDLHPSTAGRTYVDIESFPFQIPLGALLPVRIDNLLPANKNIGTTHITNGCYRLHPVEWSIGEAVGALAVTAVERRVPPRAVRADETLLAEYRSLLATRLGLTLSWPEHIRRHSWRPGGERHDAAAS